MKPIGKSIIRSESDESTRTIYIVMVSEGKTSFKNKTAKYKYTSVNSFISISYKSKKILINDLTYEINIIIIAVVK